MELIHFEIGNKFSHKPNLEGEATFKGERGSVTVILDKDAANAIVEICAEAIVRVSQEISNEMVAPLIEHKESNNDTE